MTGYFAQGLTGLKSRHWEVLSQVPPDLCQKHVVADRMCPLPTVEIIDSRNGTLTSSSLKASLIKKKNPILFN